VVQWGFSAPQRNAKKVELNYRLNFEYQWSDVDDGVHGACMYVVGHVVGHVDVADACC